jgi:hypothetical protein
MAKEPKFSLTKRGREYTARFRWEGVQHRYKTNTSDKLEARILARDHISSLVQQSKEAALSAFSGEPLKTRLATAVQNFINTEYRDRNRAAKTIKAAERYLANYLVKFTGVKNIEDLTKEVYDHAFDTAHQSLKPKSKYGPVEGLQPTSWATLLIYWRKFLFWATDEGFIESRVFKKRKIGRIPQIDRKEEIWSEDEFQAILALATEGDRETYKVLRWTGIYPSDVYELRRHHFRLDSRSNTWRLIKPRAKAKSPDEVYNQPLDGRALEVLLPRINNTKDANQKIFSDLTQYYSNEHSWTASLGHRNDDYWDMFNFEISSDRLREIRFGKDYLTKARVSGVKSAKSLPYTKYFKDHVKRKNVKSLRHTYITHQIEREDYPPIDVLRGWVGHTKDSRVLEKFYAHRRSDSQFIERTGNEG